MSVEAADGQGREVDGSNGPPYSGANEWCPYPAVSERGMVHPRHISSPSQRQTTQPFTLSLTSMENVV